MIALVGSVFSPYYHWTGRRDPLNHCAMNVALYGARSKSWSMTERGRAAVARTADTLAIGPSAMSWHGGALTVEIDEIAAPLPRRIRGTVRLFPSGVGRETYRLDAAGRHLWRPVAPCARVEVVLQNPAMRWSGEGYFDTNAGSVPLEADFSRWNWSRAAMRDGAAVLYDVTRRDGSRHKMALRFGRDGRAEDFAALPDAPLPHALWRVARATQADGGQARVLRTLEDSPFYARSVVASSLLGEDVRAMHESLDLDRFAMPLVKAMLPFRMPRAMW